MSTISLLHIFPFSHHILYKQFSVLSILNYSRFLHSFITLPICIFTPFSHRNLGLPRLPFPTHSGSPFSHPAVTSHSLHMTGQPPSLSHQLHHKLSFSPMSITNSSILRLSVPFSTAIRVTQLFSQTCILSLCSFTVSAIVVWPHSFVEVTHKHRSFEFQGYAPVCNYHFHPSYYPPANFGVWLPSLLMAPPWKQNGVFALAPPQYPPTLPLSKLAPSEYFLKIYHTEPVLRDLLHPPLPLPRRRVVLHPPLPLPRHRVVLILKRF